MKYSLKSGDVGSRCELFTRDVSVVDFIFDFKKIFSISMQGIAIGHSGLIKNLGSVRTLSQLKLLYLLYILLKVTHYKKKIRYNLNFKILFKLLFLST